MRTDLLHDEQHVRIHPLCRFRSAHQQRAVQVQHRTDWREYDLGPRRIWEKAPRLTLAKSQLFIATPLLIGCTIGELGAGWISDRLVRSYERRHNGQVSIRLQLHGRAPQTAETGRCVTKGEARSSTLATTVLLNPYCGHHRLRLPRRCQATLDRTGGVPRHRGRGRPICCDNRVHLCD